MNKCQPTKLASSRAKGKPDAAVLNCLSSGGKLRREPDSDSEACAGLCAGREELAEAPANVRKLRTGHVTQHHTPPF